MEKMIKIFFSFIFIISCFNCYGQAPAIQWSKCYGGTSDDVARSVVQASDGGYVIVGYTESNNIDVIGNHSVGISDVWIIKIDSLGTLQWQKCLGGTSGDRANFIRKTNDGGFIIAGISNSSDGDVTGNHFHSGDYWIIKIDSLGNIQWQNCFGGSMEDEALDIFQTLDQGFIVNGNTSSIDGDVQNNTHGTAEDFWVLKLDSMGNIQWQKALGGFFTDWGCSITQISNNKYCVSGWVGSYDHDVTCGHGGYEIWVVNLDSLGNINDQYCFGGSSDEELGRLIVLNRNNMIIGGSTSSNDGNISGNHGLADMWLAKSDSSGNIFWNSCFGGLSNEECFAIDTTNDGGFILAGRSNSNDSLVQNHGFGLDDVYVAKTDSLGSKIWDINLGGTDDERAYSVLQARDGGFLVVGYTSSANGDVSGHYGGKDFWVVKLAPIGLGINLNDLNFDFTVHFNESKNLQLDFSSDSEDDITVKMFDVTGRELLNEKRQKHIGVNRINFVMNNLNSGLYLITVNTNQKNFTKKIILSK